MGFPIVGEMQPLMAGTVEEDKLNTPKPVQDLVDEQEETNYQVAARVKFSEWSEEVMEKTMSDSEIGRMSVPLRKTTGGSEELLAQPTFGRERV